VPAGGRPGPVGGATDRANGGAAGPAPASPRYRSAIAVRRPAPRVTLARALSKLGVLSRTQARAAIAAGRVAVDGSIERDPDRWLDPAGAVIELDGVRAERTERCYLAMHKPVGVVTTRADERGRRTVYELLPDGLPFVSPVGRLDRDSSGLLLFTNDTQLADAISGPRGHVPKVYEVDLDAPLGERDAARFAAGMELDGELLLPVAVAFADARDRRRAVLTLREGKNRQIRRMAAACGRTVERLHRVAIGPVRLADLAAGAVRVLAPDELAALCAVAAVDP